MMCYFYGIIITWAREPFVYYINTFISLMIDSISYISSRFLMTRVTDTSDTYERWICINIHLLRFLRDISIAWASFLCIFRYYIFESEFKHKAR